MGKGEEEKGGRKRREEYEVEKLEEKATNKVQKRERRDIRRGEVG